VGQAQDCEVGIVKRLAPRLGILAPRFVQRQQHELAAPGEPLRNLQSGSTHRAVDKNRVRHQASASSRSSFTYPTGPSSDRQPQAQVPTISSTSKLSPSISVQSSSAPSPGADISGAPPGMTARGCGTAKCATKNFPARPI